jgi:hypothetical protein
LIFGELKGFSFLSIAKDNQMVSSAQTCEIGAVPSILRYLVHCIASTIESRSLIARYPRAEVEGGLYHIIALGRPQQNIFSFYIKSEPIKKTKRRLFNYLNLVFLLNLIT